MRTRDRISAGTIAASGATLVAVIFTPAPRAPTSTRPAGEAGVSSERILLTAMAEQRAALKYRSDLKDLDGRVDPLRERFAAEGTGAEDPSSDSGGRGDREVIRSEVARELGRRWREFQRRLREIRK